MALVLRDLAAAVPALALVAGQLPVGVQRHRVHAQNVGRVGNPSQLHDLSADHPALVAAPHPGDTSHGRQGEGQKAGEDAHSRGSMSNRTNECGGRGPVYLNRIRPTCWPPSSSTATSKASIRSRATRNEAFSATRSWPGSPT